MRPRRSTSRRAFTLVEVLLAGLITSMVIGSVGMSLSELARSKSLSKERFDACLRADAALSALRRDVVSVIRADDLFFTRLRIFDDSVNTFAGEMDRDEILLFVTRLRTVRDPEHFTGEGIEYETQYRIEEDDLGPVLWQRRDAFPDEYPDGGGVATPVVNGVTGLRIEAYDGDVWHTEWDSDEQGLPLAVAITVAASGHRGEDDVYDARLVYLRTVVPIDRVVPPRDIFEVEEMEWRELEAEEEGLDPEEALGAAPDLEELGLDGEGEEIIGGGAGEEGVGPDGEPRGSGSGDTPRGGGRRGPGVPPPPPPGGGGGGRRGGGGGSIRDN